MSFIQSNTASGGGPAPGGSSVQSYLAADVAIPVANTFVNGPNTGAIGQAGQQWWIFAQAVMQGPSSGQANVELAIFDGTARIANNNNITPVASAQIQLSTGILVTLAGPTTFTLQGTSQAGTDASLKTTGVAHTTNKATSITAIRLA